MKKDYLLYLKKMMTLGCMITSVGLLGGCAASDTEDNNRTITESQDKEMDFHYHLMLDIGGTIYIFRECDDNISEIKVDYNYGNVRYRIYDTNEEKLIDSKSYGDADCFGITDDKQEKIVREFENTAIENGAVIYRGLGR